MHTAIWILLIGGGLVGLMFLGAKHTIDTNSWYYSEGKVIDKFTSGGINGVMYCIIEVDGERYRTNAGGCFDVIVGDIIDVKMKKNSETGVITVSWIKGVK